MSILPDKKTCKRCKYEWIPRTEYPRECPSCKTRIWEHGSDARIKKRVTPQEIFLEVAK